MEPIKLTFKSGFLWYGDYQVVNPQVIPSITVMMEMDKPFLHVNNGVHSLRELVDGDTLTLPEGYGIREKYQVKDFKVNGGWLPISKELYVYDRDVVRPEKKAETRIIATITLPEKPENSAHLCEECTAYFGYQMSKCLHCTKVVEPSESQEEPTENEKERYRLGYKDGYSDGWNEALDRAIEIIEREALVTSEGIRSRIEELQKLRK